MLDDTDQYPDHPDDCFRIEVSYQQEQRFIKIYVSGKLTAEANRELVLTAIEASRKYDCNRILLDERHITIVLSFVEIYDLPQINEQLGVSNIYRVAIVYDKSITNDKAFQFYENRAAIFDLKHYIFYDEEKAISWLLSNE